MKSIDILTTMNTIWVIIAGVLVIFMQAGFALLEAGLCRMKNAAHIAVKNLIVLGVVAVTYWAVGFGLAFGKGGNALFGGSGFFPGSGDLLSYTSGPYDWFYQVAGAEGTGITGAAGYVFEVAFAAVSLAIVWGAIAERVRLWVYFAFGAVFTVIYSVASHWIWNGSASGQGWLWAKGMQDFAGSTVVHYQGALAGLAGLLLIGPRIGKYDRDGKANAIPGHNMVYAVLGTVILWFGWFGFNPGSTLSVNFGGLGFFAYVALTTNIAAAAGAVSGGVVSWIVLKKCDASMVLNGALGALVAITAACAFVEPWAAGLIGIVSGAIAVFGVIGVERLRLDDPIGALSVHGMSGIWGTLAVGLFATDKLSKGVATGHAGLFYGGGFSQLWVQVQGLAAVGAFTFGASFITFWLFKTLVPGGIRVTPEVELAGLDIHEHGMWGYPEMYIPIPGGYGAEHSHAPVGRPATVTQAAIVPTGD